MRPCSHTKHSKGALKFRKPLQTTANHHEPPPNLYKYKLSQNACLTVSNKFYWRHYQNVKHFTHDVDHHVYEHLDMTSLITKRNWPVFLEMFSQLKDTTRPYSFSGPLWLLDLYERLYRTSPIKWWPEIKIDVSVSDTTVSVSFFYLIIPHRPGRTWAGYRPSSPRGSFVHYDFLKKNKNKKTLYTKHNEKC